MDCRETNQDIRKRIWPLGLPGRSAGLSVLSLGARLHLVHPSSYYRGSRLERTKGHEMTAVIIWYDCDKQDTSSQCKSRVDQVIGSPERCAASEGVENSNIIRHHLESNSRPPYLNWILRHRLPLRQSQSKDPETS